MELKRFNQKDIIFALDIGTRSIIGTVGIVKDKKFQVVCEKYLEHEERAMVGNCSVVFNSIHLLSYYEI